MKKNMLGVPMCAAIVALGGAIAVSVLRTPKVSGKLAQLQRNRPGRRVAMRQRMEEPIGVKLFEDIERTSEDNQLPQTSKDFFSVTFYDWDSTYLGTRIVGRGGDLRGDHRSKTECGTDHDQAPKPPEGELLFDPEGMGEYQFYGPNDPRNCICNKRGYTFAGWVDAKTGDSIPNATAILTRGQQVPQEQLVLLKNICHNMVLKAAYDEDRMVLGPNTGTRKYQISNRPFRKKGNTFYTEVIVRRPENARRIPEGEKYLLVTSKLKDWGAFPVQYPLGDKDVEVLPLTLPLPAARYDQDGALCLTIIDANGEPRSSNIWVKLEDTPDEAAKE